MHWQLLGELELQAGMDPDAALRAWLVELLAPFTWRGDFLMRFLQSARDVAARAFGDGTGIGSDHIHLVIYGPRGLEAKPGTWGFFHVEKMVTPADGSSPVIHSIEFYMYVEGYS